MAEKIPEKNQTKPAAEIPEALKATPEASTPDPTALDRGFARAAAITGLPAVGDVLVDEGDTEIVITRRKKAAKPTGRHVTRSNYRCEVQSRDAAEKLREEGAEVQEVRFDRDHPSRAGQMTFHVFLPAPSDHTGNDLHLVPAHNRKGYTLPPDVAAHGVKAGALEPEKA